MDKEETRKVGIEAFIGDETKQAGEAIAKATSGYDKMMRSYEKAMRAATGSLHSDAAYRAACGSFNDAAYRAAFGSMHDAAYSEARRVAEMTRAALVPNFTQQAKDISVAARQICESVTGAAAFREMDLGMHACRDAIEAIVGPTKYLETSLTRDLVSNFKAFQKSFDLSPAFDAAAIRRIDELQESMHAALTSLPDLTERPITFLPPRPVEKQPNPAGQFLLSFKQQYDDAVNQAAEQDGVVVVFSKTPTGDPIVVKEMSSLDQHFIQVTGVDQHNQARTFKANCSGLALQIEIVPIEEDPDRDSDEDEDLVN